MMIASLASSSIRTSTFRQWTPLSLMDRPEDKASETTEELEATSADISWSLSSMSLSKRRAMLLCGDRDVKMKVAETEFISRTERERRGVQGRMACHLEAEDMSTCVSAIRATDDFVDTSRRSNQLRAESRINGSMDPACKYRPRPGATIKDPQRPAPNQLKYESFSSSSSDNHSRP